MWFFEAAIKVASTVVGALLLLAIILHLTGLRAKPCPDYLCHSTSISKKLDDARPKTNPSVQRDIDRARMRMKRAEELGISN